MKPIYFFALFFCPTLYCMEQKNNQIAQKLIKYVHYVPDALLLAQKKGTKAKLLVNHRKALAMHVALTAIRDNYPYLNNIHASPNVLNLMIAGNELSQKIPNKLKKLSNKFNTDLTYRNEFKNLLMATLHPAVQCDYAMKKYKELGNLIVCKQNPCRYPTDIFCQKVNKRIWKFKFIENYVDVYAGHIDCTQHIVSYNFKKKTVSGLSSSTEWQEIYY